MTTAVQNRKVLTQLTTKFIEKSVTPQSHWMRLIGGTFMSKSEQIEWQSREISEDIAEDVERNTNGNANSFSNVSEFSISGAEFHETLNMNQILTSVVGAGSVNVEDPMMMSDYFAELKRRTDHVLRKFSRADEKAAAQFLNTGVIQYKIKGAFDFGRPASALKDVGAAQYWNNVTADIKTQALDAINYFRDVALHTGGEFNWSMSQRQWIALIATNQFTEDKKNIQYVDIKRVLPKYSEDGATYMGTLEVAGAIFNFWVYNGKAKGAQTGGSSLETYMPNHKSVITPVNFDLGEDTSFPIDTGMTGEAQMVIKKIHSWREYNSGSDTLVQHMKKRSNIIAYYEKMVYTIQTFASAT